MTITERKNGNMAWNWKSSDPAMTNSARTTFELRLPRGFAFIDAAFGDPSSFKTVPLPDGGAHAPFRAAEKFNGVAPGREYTSWNVLGVLVESTGPIGTSGNLEFRVFKDGELASPNDAARRLTATVRIVYNIRQSNAHKGDCLWRRLDCL